MPHYKVLAKANRYFFSSENQKVLIFDKVFDTSPAMVEKVKPVEIYQLKEQCAYLNCTVIAANVFEAEQMAAQMFTDFCKRVVPAT